MRDKAGFIEISSTDSSIIKCGICAKKKLVTIYCANKGLQGKIVIVCCDGRIVEYRIIKRAALHNVYVQSLVSLNTEKVVFAGYACLLNINVERIVKIFCRTKVIAIDGAVKIVTLANVFLINEQVIRSARYGKCLNGGSAYLLKFGINLHISCERSIQKRVPGEGLLPAVLIPEPSLEFIALLYGVVWHSNNFATRCINGMYYCVVNHEVNLEIDLAAAYKHANRQREQSIKCYCFAFERS